MATERGVRFWVYQDKAGEWRWRLVAGNGKTVCDSGEGYGRRADCVYAVERVQMLAVRARLEIDAPGGQGRKRQPGPAGNRKPATTEPVLRPGLLM